MDSVDLELEEFIVSKAVALPLEDTDFGVGSFQLGSRDAVVVVGQEAGAVGGQRLGELLEHSNAGGCRAADPVLEKGGRRQLVGLRPELAQVFLEVVGGGQRGAGAARPLPGVCVRPWIRRSCRDVSATASGRL